MKRKPKWRYWVCVCPRCRLSPMAGCVAANRGIYDRSLRRMSFEDCSISIATANRRGLNYSFQRGDFVPLVGGER